MTLFFVLNKFCENKKVIYIDLSDYLAEIYIMKYKMVFIEAKILEVAKQEITKSKFFFTIFLFNDIIKYFQKKTNTVRHIKNSHYSICLFVR